jgi:hypothetical protein
MKSKVIRNRFAKRFVARALGVGMVAGLAFAAAQAASVQTLDISNSWGGTIPYYYNDGLGNADTWTPAFSIEAKTPERGWFSGNGTTDGFATSALTALTFRQQNKAPKICVEVSKPGTGWQGEQCTSGIGSAITVGVTNDTAPIEAISVRLKDCDTNDNLSANAYVLYKPGTPFVQGAPAHTETRVRYYTCGLIFTCSENYTVTVPGTPDQPAVPAIATWQQQDDPSAMLNSHFTANTCGQKLTLGVQGGGGTPRIDAINLKIKRNDCPSCSS